MSNPLTAEILEDRQPATPNADRIIAEEAAATAAAGAPVLAPEVQASFPGFDPALHEADALGKPIKNTDGTLRKKRGRKGAGGKFISNKPAAEMKSAVEIGQAEGATQVLPPEPPKQITREAARVTAAQFVGLGFAVAVGVFGDEWKPEPPEKHPMGIDEAQAMTDALTEYVYAEQFAGLSPGFGALLAVGMYAGIRVNRPTTRQKIAGWVAKARKLFLGR